MKKSDQVTKGAELSRLVKNYVLENIDSSGYEIEVKTDEEKLRFLADTFKKEYGWVINRYGKSKALAEWFMGLPSACTIAFENYKILELARKWKSIPEHATESKEQKILANWFNLCACKTLQMFSAYNIEIN